MFFQEIVFVFVSEGHDVGHVDFVEGGEEGCGVLGVFESLGDSLSHSGHFDSSFGSGG